MCSMTRARHQSAVRCCSGAACRCVQVCRVYIGSFNGLKDIRSDINPNCVPLFQKEQVPLPFLANMKKKRSRGVALHNESGELMEP